MTKFFFFAKRNGNSIRWYVMLERFISRVGKECIVLDEYNEKWKSICFEPRQIDQNPNLKIEEEFQSLHYIIGKRVIWWTPFFHTLIIPHLREEEKISEEIKISSHMTDRMPNLISTKWLIYWFLCPIYKLTNTHVTPAHHGPESQPRTRTVLNGRKEKS